MPTMPKNTYAVWSMRWSSGLPFSPSQCSAKAKRIANNRICRISPSAKAPTTVAGMMCKRNSTVLCSPAFAVYAEIDDVSSVAGSMFIPTPGRQRFTMTRPIIAQ